MRIAFPVFDLGRSGGLKVICRLSEAAVTRGHEVSILVPEGVAEDPSMKLSANIERVKPLPVPRPSGYSPLLLLSGSFPIARRLRGYDAVVANFAPTSFTVKLVEGRNTRRYYLIQHDETAFFSSLSLEQVITRLSYTSFRDGRIMVVSKWLQDMVRERSGLGSVIIPPGIDHEVYRPRERRPHDGKRVLVLSRGGHHWRGMHVFLGAMEAVRKELGDVTIVAAGHTGRPLETSCKVDYVRPTDNELADLYASCDAFVLPSFLEGLPVPPLEAMACGGAVVVSDCMGTRDYAKDGENCLEVPRDNPRALGEAILRVLTDEVLSDRLRKNGPAAAAPWTYERMGRVFLETIERG